MQPVLNNIARHFKLILLKTMRSTSFLQKIFLSHQTLNIGLNRASYYRTQTCSFATMVDKQAEIREFWLGKSVEESSSLLAFDHESLKRWFFKSNSTDEEIKAKFEDDVKRIGRGEYDEWKKDLKGIVSGVVLMDQFTRNIYRDTAEMYSLDATCREWVQQALEREDEVAKLKVIERKILYLSMLHQENITDCEAAVNKLKELVAYVEAEEGDNSALLGFLKLATASYVEHAEVLRKWGRYPHRNQILGREDTEEEKKAKEEGNIPSY